MKEQTVDKLIKIFLIVVSIVAMSLIGLLFGYGMFIIVSESAFVGIILCALSLVFALGEITLFFVVKKMVEDMKEW